ncbi:RNA 2'-phosphotransferase [Neomegalonema sp.]|uniref:RNA 2'-phosphotransferase n=1 Tax=Neomegalonema sp. TaxID=2039713 RepID=UPI0026355436|nr:RNA 2'-phosphotransferase [Neomegalonema sp.]MDD2869417.1 RNA 2'-phosphotransferase [Neomegalonema sp.]
MGHPDLKTRSKFLSLVLRHAPETIGLKLDAQGWAPVPELLAKMKAAGHKISAEDLREIVETNDKKRFTLSEDGRRIRAAQGHSVAVDLGLPSAEPPEILYHGTARANLDSIFAEGLKPGSRRQVHLSREIETARKVGTRHGGPVVLTVAAGAMHRAGIAFQQAENGVWLTDHVPPAHLGFAENEG